MITVFYSCSVDELFNIGIRLPSPHSRYARLKYKEVHAPFDVIVVPGFPYQQDVPSIIKLRLCWARYLFNAGITENIIFSGSAVYSPYLEGVALKIMADSLGLPSHRTFAETHAEHSIENVYYSMKMARAMGFKKIAVATDPFQAKMLEPLVAKYCPDITVIPIVYSKIRGETDRIPLIDPSSAFVNNFVSLKEIETKAQRHRGTKGRRIESEIQAENLHRLFLESKQMEMQTQLDSTTLSVPRQ
jgi:hypothetical protein